MNVLSLFDGISCGQVAFEKLGIKFDGVENKYFASEIDEKAIFITQKNYPNTTQLGDVIKIDLESLPNIDIIIGGSPCQGFSFAGSQLCFDDPRSKLVLNYIDFVHKIHPKYFLLENVKMNEQSKQVISNALGVEPVLINSDLFVCQNRPRLYWTNIPIDISKLPSRPDWNEQYYQYRRTYWRELKNGTCCCLTANMGTGGNNVPYEVVNDEKIKLTPIDCEKLQGLPENYTDGICKTARYKAIGNGWTVDVIAWILSFLPMVDGESYRKTFDNSEVVNER